MMRVGPVCGTGILPVVTGRKPVLRNWLDADDPCQAQIEMSAFSGH